MNTQHGGLLGSDPLFPTSGLWPLAERGGGYRPIANIPGQPPAEVTAAMRRYLDLFGLSFGAFDFGITSDGQWLAYECNPSAQWLWLEHQTNISISSALAELLTAGTIKCSTGWTRPAP